MDDNYRIGIHYLQRVFKDFPSACKAGFFNDRYWARRGRIGRNLPSAVICTKFYSHDRGYSYPFIFQGQYVVDDFVAVWSLDETELKVEPKPVTILEKPENPINEHVVNISISNKSIPPLPSYDDPCRHKINNGNKLKTKNTKPKKRLNRKVNNKEVAVYFPITEDPNQFSDWQKYILHKLYLDKVLGQKSKDEFTNLNKATFREMVGKTKTADEALNELLKQGTIITDGWYSPDQHKSLGYRYKDPEAKYQKIPLNDTKVINRLNSHKQKRKGIYDYLETQLQKLTITTIPDDDLLFIAITTPSRKAAPKSNLERVKEWKRIINMILLGGMETIVDSNSGRMFSLLTNLKRELRKYLLVNNQSLAEADIPNAQPLFLSLLTTQRQIYDPQFRQLCQGGRLYQFLADKAGTTRDKAKIEITEHILFGSIKYKSKVKSIFESEFPSIAQFINEMKAKSKGARKLALLLQYEESRFVIHRCCSRIKQEKPEMFVATIHDSIVASPADIEYVKSIMQDEFQKMNLAVPVKVKHYA